MGSTSLSPVERGAAQLDKITTAGRFGHPVNIVNIGEFLSQEIPEPEHLLKPLITANSLNMVYSWRGVGKTWFSLSVAYAIASGGKYLNWEAASPKRVLYLDGEMPMHTLQKRLKHIVLGSETQAPPDNFCIFTPDNSGGRVPDLATIAGQLAIDEVISIHKPDFLVIDNLSCWVRSGGAENEAESWLPVNEWLLRHRSNGLAVLLVHHSGKSGAQRGSSKKEDTLDLSLDLRRPPTYEPEHGAAFVVEFKKARHLHGVDAEPFEAALTIDDDGKAMWKTTASKVSTYDRVIELYELGLSNKDISEELQINKSGVSRHIKKGIELGRIRPRHRDDKKEGDQ